LVEFRDAGYSLTPPLVTQVYNLSHNVNNKILFNEVLSLTIKSTIYSQTYFFRSTPSSPSQVPWRNGRNASAAKAAEHFLKKSINRETMWGEFFKAKDLATILIAISGKTGNIGKFKHHRPLSKN
jgi:hypothetical protein